MICVKVLPGLCIYAIRIEPRPRLPEAKTSTTTATVASGCAGAVADGMLEVEADDNAGSVITHYSVWRGA